MRDISCVIYYKEQLETRHPRYAVQDGLVLKWNSKFSMKQIFWLSCFCWTSVWACFLMDYHKSRQKFNQKFQNFCNERCSGLHNMVYHFITRWQDNNKVIAIQRIQGARSNNNIFAVKLSKIIPWELIVSCTLGETPVELLFMTYKMKNCFSLLWDKKVRLNQKIISQFEGMLKFEFGLNLVRDASVWQIINRYMSLRMSCF